MSNGKDEGDGLAQAIALIMILALVGSVIAGILAALRELARAITKLVEMIGKLLLLYIGVFLAALVLAVLIDIAASGWRTWQRKRRRKRSITYSNFPNRAFLHDSQYLDSVFWRMVEHYLDRRLTALQRKERAASAKRRKELDHEIGNQKLLRNLLVEEDRFFREWKREHYFDVVTDEKNRHLLLEAYGRVWSFCVEEVRRHRKTGKEVSLFTANVLSGMALEHEPDFWHATKLCSSVLSFGRLSSKKSQEALSFAESKEDRILRMFSGDTRNEQRFHRFLDLHLFELMDKVGSFPLLASDHHEAQRKPQEVRLKSVPTSLPAQRASVIQAETESTKAEKAKEDERQEREKRRMEEARRREAEQRQREEEQHKIHAYELAEEARRERAESELAVLRKRYLGEMTPGMHYHQVKNGEGALFEDIRDFAFERVSGDEQARGAFEEIRFNRFKFLDFWKQHELEILRRHDERMQLAKILKKDSRLRQIQEEQQKAQTQRRQQWIEETSKKALASYSEREKQVREGQMALADEEFGFLLALAGEKIKERLPNQEHDLVLAFLQREIRALLEKLGAEQEYFSPEARRATRHCNLFRLGRLPYSAVVEHDGIQRKSSLDSLVRAFYRHQERWFIEYLSESFSLPKSLKAEIKRIQDQEGTPLEIFYQTLPRNKAALMKLFQVFENEVKHGRIGSTIS
jgi:hypothetical protein